MLREVVDQNCVGGISCASARAPGVNFQACSFNHSDISPCKWNQQFTGGRGPAQPQTVTDIVGELHDRLVGDSLEFSIPVTVFRCRAPSDGASSGCRSASMRMCE